MSSGWALITRARRSLMARAYGWLGSDGEWQLLETAEVEAAVPLRVGHRLDGREASHQRSDGDLGLEACERGAEAVVRPTTEGEVLLRVGACDVDLIGGRAPPGPLPVRRRPAPHGG